MQNGAEDQPAGSVGPLIAALLEHPDRVTALAPTTVHEVLVEVAGLHQRLATLSMVLTIRLRQEGTATAAEARARPSPEQGALTQAQAAEAYCMPVRTLRRLTRTGRVPSYRQGRNRMIRPTDLDRYLARCRAQAVKVGTLLDV